MKMMSKFKLCLTLIVVLVNIVNRSGGGVGGIASASASDYDADEYDDLETAETRTDTDITNIEPPQAWHLTTASTSTHVETSLNFDKQNYDGYTEFPTERRKRRPGRKRKRRPANTEEYWRGPAVEEDTDGQPSENLNERRRKTNFDNVDSNSNYNINNYNGNINNNGKRKRPSLDREVGISSTEPPRVKHKLRDGSRHASSSVRVIAKDANESRENSETNPRSYRKPYSQYKKLDEEAPLPDNSKTPDLKAILKQSGGLSLSEILQQRNLSLTDLLKGKQIALAALTDSPKINAVPDPVVNAPERKPSSGLRQTTPNSRTTETLDSRITNGDSDNGKRNLKLPVIGKVRTVPTESIASNEKSEIKPVRRIPTFTSSVPRVNNENYNFIDETIDVTTPIAISQDVNTTFSTADLKELTLNPIMPTVKEDKRRPIKGIVSKIRPDLSNSNTKTEEMYESSKRHSQRYNSNMNTSNRNSTMHREKWTPGSSLSRREKMNLKFNQTSGPVLKPTAETNVLESTSVDSIPDDETETEAMEGSLFTTVTSQPENTFPTTTTTATTTTTTTTAAPLRDVYLIRQKPLKTRMRLPVVEKEPLSNIEVKDNPESAEFENYPIFNVTPKQKKVDSSLNAIQKNATIDDIIPTNISPLNEILEENFSSNQEPFDPPVSDRNSRAKKFGGQQRLSNGFSNTQRSFTLSNDYTTIRDVTESNPSLFADLTSPKTLDDKVDILELIRDRRNGARLTKVLSQRNMTLEELLAHRERGSSNLHLSEIVNGKSKKIKDFNFDDKFDIVTAFENFPRFNIGNLKSVQPDDIKTDSQGFSYFTSIINIRPTDEIYKEARQLQDLQKEKKSPFGEWNSIKFGGESNYLGNGGGARAAIVASRVSPPTDRADDTDANMIKRAEAIEHEIHRANELLEFNSLGANEDYQKNLVTIETTQIPAGIRSAIIASSSIVGVCLFIFILIFIACRWRHNRKTKLNYTENFKIAKGRLPILQKEQMKNAQCQSQCSGMYPTTRCSSKLNTMDPNSPEVQDYLWDTMRKPFQ